jgi:hypothetical protein
MLLTFLTLENISERPDMIILMFHVDSFWFRPFSEESKESETQESFGESLLVWIQAEGKDEDDRVAVLRKMVKNIRWLAKKHSLNRIILHSFAHLAESKASPELASSLIEETATRLRDRDYTVYCVHYGLNEFQMHVKGPSLSKVFKQF